VQQRYRRLAGDETDMGVGTGTSVDVRQVLEGLDLEDHQDPANVAETRWNDHDDDLEGTINNEVCKCTVRRPALMLNVRITVKQVAKVVY